MNRRDLLKTAALAGTTLLGGGFFNRARGEVGEARPRSNAPLLPRRPYGKTGVELSIIGFPGLAVKELEPERVQRMVAEAVERGVNYFDVAPQYGDAEIRLGPALEPYRRKVFLACKTQQRTREGSAAELKRSLERLRTDHFDLYQLHSLTESHEVDTAFGKGGAIETLVEARKEGRVRFLGFSCHSVEAALTAMDRFDFDSVLFPLNFACMMKGNWGPQIVAKAKAKGVIMLALKALCRQQWPENSRRNERYRRCWYQPITDLDEADLSLRYTLSQGATAALPPAAEFLFRPALNLAMDYRPITADEEKQLRKLAEGLRPLFSHG